MTRRPLTLLVALLAAVNAIPARADTQLSTPDGSNARYTSWMDTMLVPPPPGTIVIRDLTDPSVPSWCYGLDGCFDPVTQDVVLAPWANATVFEHELGHVFDWRVMTSRFREEFLRLTHQRPPWYMPGTSETASGVPRPDEVFADVYGMCARHRVIQRPESTAAYDFRLTPRMFRRVCDLIRCYHVTTRQSPAAPLPPAPLALPLTLPPPPPPPAP